VNQFCFSDGESDTNLRHAKTTAVVIALKEAPSIAYSDTRRERMDKCVLTMLASDKVIQYNRNRNLAFVADNLQATVLQFECFICSL